MSLLADRFKPSQLSFAAGFYYIGVPIGSGASLLIAGYLGTAIGWRNCFFLLGFSGLLMSLLIVFVKDPRAGSAAHVAANANRKSFAQQMAVLGAALTRSPSLIATIAGGVALHFSVGAAAFDQLWYVQERGFDRAQIAQITGFLTVAGGIAGNLFGGFIGDWWQKNTKSGRPMLLFWLILAFAPFNIAYRLVPPDSPFFYLGIALGIFQLAAFYGPTFSTVQELAPPEARGTVTAFYILCLNVIGLGIGITGSGWLVDQLRSGGAAHPYSLTLLVFVLLSFLSLPAFFLAGRWFKSDRDRLQASS